jgi:hypothetical protein
MLDHQTHPLLNLDRAEPSEADDEATQAELDRLRALIETIPFSPLYLESQGR